MADDSKFVIRWEIPDAAAKYASGKMESEEYHERGFRWITGFERVGEKVKVSLRCAMDHSGPWKCEVELTVCEIDKNGGSWGREGGQFCFNDTRCMQHYILHDFTLVNFMSPSYMVSGRATFEFRIIIISSERTNPSVDLAMFTAPNDMSNVTLKIGDKKLHVSKEYLAIHSPVFKTLFFGDFAEKGKDEVEIKDVNYEEFIDLLQFIYLHRTAPHLLKLADRFQIESLIEHSKNHLAQSKGIDVAKKLLLADQYNIVALRDHCLNSFTDANTLTAKMKSSNEFDNFSDGMKAAICARIIALH